MGSAVPLDRIRKAPPKRGQSRQRRNRERTHVSAGAAYARLHRPYSGKSAAAVQCITDSSSWCSSKTDHSRLGKPTEQPEP
jgi:hypothetical protein